MTGASQCVIGLDVGGTKIAARLVSWPEGRSMLQLLTPTAAERGGDVVLTTAVALADQLRSEAQKQQLELLGIGVGVCELVDLQGNVTSGHTVAWNGLPVKAQFEWLAPTVVEADIRAHALAEATLGAGQPYKLFVYISVGTGISACLVQDRRPLAGARGNALVLASAPYTTTCPNCGTTSDFILEDYASGPALAARFGATGAEQVLEAARLGDGKAVEIVTSAGTALGNNVGWLVNQLDPEAVVVGGGLGVAGGLYWQSFVESTRAHIWSEATRSLPILPAALGKESGVIGAALVAGYQFGRRTD